MIQAALLYILFTFSFALTGFTPASNYISKQQGRIINGYDAKPGQFPWQVSIEAKYFSDIDWTFWCGGVLISPRHVLSAGHCFSVGIGIENFRFIAGAHRWNDKNEKWQQMTIACREEKHPKFHQDNSTDELKYDVSVITLKTPMTITDRVKPIRLSPRNSNPVGETCIASGWGNTNPDRSGNLTFSDILQFLNMTVLSIEECRKLLRLSHLPEAFLSPDENNICAMYADIADGVKNPSNGDSGGSLTCFDEIGPYVAGIVSYGTEANDTPAITVFAKVAHVLDFITCGAK